MGGATEGKEHCGMLLLEANFSDWRHPDESIADWMECKLEAPAFMNVALFCNISFAIASLSIPYAFRYLAQFV